MGDLLQELLDGCRKNRLGGINVDSEDKSVADEAKLITLPKDIDGKNCSNCQFIGKNHVCEHPKLKGIEVNDRMGCKYWDNPGVLKA